MTESTTYPPLDLTETEPAHQPSEYVYIAAWGEILGSFPEYVATEQRQASEAGAPVTAVFFNTGSGWWITADEITSVDILRRVIAIVGRA